MAAWLARLLDGWQAGWLADLLAGWLAGWLALPAVLSGSPARWLAGCGLGGCVAPCMIRIPVRMTAFLSAFLSACPRSCPRVRVNAVKVRIFF